MKQDNIIVIGAGVGGLCAAIYLASRGKQVQVFEQNATAGGKMNEMVFDGYRFDTGPSLMTMTFVLDEMRKAVGQEFDDQLELIPIDPICRYFWSDGTQLSVDYYATNKLAS
jgi:phytoene desaturase